MGYLAGPSPNNWGILHDGRHISDLLTKATGSDEERRSHPLFGHVVLLVMQEVTILCRSMLCFVLLCSHHSTRHSLHRPRSMLLSQHYLHFLPLSTLILRPVCFLSYTQVVNKRLFAVVREERRLTYDASFKLLGQNSIQGGWYQVSVTSNPSQVRYSHLLKMKALSL